MKQQSKCYEFYVFGSGRLQGTVRTFRTMSAAVRHAKFLADREQRNVRFTVVGETYGTVIHPQLPLELR